MMFGRCAADTVTAANRKMKNRFMGGNRQRQKPYPVKDFSLYRAAFGIVPVEHLLGGVLVEILLVPDGVALFVRKNFLELPAILLAAKRPVFLPRRHIRYLVVPP